MSLSYVICHVALVWLWQWPACGVADGCFWRGSSRGGTCVVAMKKTNVISRASREKNVMDQTANNIHIYTIAFRMGFRW